MTKALTKPDYIFETSWEVCNKVGGIYTVLSTQAATLQAAFPDHILFVGPDLTRGEENPLFIPSGTLFAEWRTAIAQEGLAVRVGRWRVPGEPLVLLVDFRRFLAEKNEIYTLAWEKFGVDSLHAYGDYDESMAFAYAAGKVTESFCRRYVKPTEKVVFQAHEWMTGLAALYLQAKMPSVATVFTTHATTIGRSIAGNDRPLYDAMSSYDGDAMAETLNVQSKHSIEKQTAHHVDCFTTVSEITACECAQLLSKPVDKILPNGFEPLFVPPTSKQIYWQRRAHAQFLQAASALTSSRLSNDTFIVGISGRYEYKNKGIDLFVEALHRIAQLPHLRRPVLGVFCIPADVAEPRADLRARLDKKDTSDRALPYPWMTHWLRNMEHDRLIGHLRYLGLNNTPDSNVTVLFVPCYLNGADGIFNHSYYELLSGWDMGVFPSYYEPWGYTPLESCAFRIPTVTTDLAGFGRWATQATAQHDISPEGVTVIDRTDSNYMQAAEALMQTILRVSTFNRRQINIARRAAATLAERASWNHFIQHYYEAYDIALTRAAERIATN